jgi:uncharacterized lipoprotein YddW (UPF0748 family)
MKNWVATDDLDSMRRANIFLNYFICLAIFFLLILSVQLPIALSATRSQAASSPTTELRGVWLTNVSSGVLFAPWGVNRAIARLSELNFNTVYPVVWNRGHTFYPSRVAQQVTGDRENRFLAVTRGGQDLLAEIIKESHQKGLSVIPWFEYGLIVPATSTVVRDRPDWLARNRAGETRLLENKTEEDFLKEARSPNSAAKPKKNKKKTLEQVWLNPFHPAVQRFISDLLIEVVMNYEVDGIQLDDHFGLPVELGYDAYTIRLYQKEHNGKKPPNNPRDPEWMRWRAAKLTNFMSQLVRAVKTVNTNAKISLSPNSHHFSYQNYLQDWKTWVEKGLIDELVLQVYRDDPDRFAVELSQPAVEYARSRIPVSVGILTGTWDRLVDAKQIQQQVKIARDRGLKGVSFFYWETLWGYLTPEAPRQRRQTFQKLFAHPAERPV